MMEFIREHKKTIFWITLIGFLFATFAYFGAGGSLISGQDTVATVNSEKVSYTEYSNAVSRAIDNARKDKKDTELTDGEMQQLKRNVIQDMISEEAFFQLALKYGIRVTDGEIRAHLQQIPAFQKDGHFDHRTYYQVLAYGLKMTPEEFEKSRRRALAVDKVRFLIYLLSKVSEREAEFEYLRRNKNLKNWTKEKNEFIATLQSEKRMHLFQQWVAQLQQKVKIKDYLAKFEQSGRQ